MRKPLPAPPHASTPVETPSPALPAVGEGKRGVEGHIGYLLRQAAAAQRHAMDLALADVGLTAPQFVVLTLIEAYSGLSGADLARLALLTPQTISLIVANLDKAGAVARRRHAVHGRIVHLDATPTGRTLLDAARRRVAEVERRILDDLTPDEERVVRRWLVATAGMGAETP